MKGKVIWITGLSGAGKTTIGKLLFEELKFHQDNIVFLDGDTLREVFGKDLGYSINERKESAMRNARICKLISDQGIDVICSTISMFQEIWNWNRENIKNYFEIFLDVPMSVLIERDQKQLYSKASMGIEKNLFGVNIQMQVPDQPHMIIPNDGTRTPQEIVYSILAEFK